MFKKFVTIATVIAIAFTAMACPAFAKAKHPKTVKAKKVIECPYCLDGSHKDCPYWLHNGKGRHMTEAEIEEFLFIESHYQDEDGVWHDR